MRVKVYTLQESREKLKITNCFFYYSITQLFTYFSVLLILIYQFSKGFCEIKSISN